MEHLSFASYLAKDLRMNETWTWTGSSRGINKHNTALPVHYQGTCEGVMPFKIGTIHSMAQMWVQALCYKGDSAKLQRGGGQALKDDSKFPSKGSGGRVFLVHPGDRAQSKTWGLETTGVLAGQKVGCWTRRSRLKVERCTGLTVGHALWRTSSVVCMCVQLCKAPWNPMDCSLPGSSVHGDSPGKNTGVGCDFLFQGTFLIQGSNPPLSHLLHWQADSLPLSHLENPVLNILLGDKTWLMSTYLKSHAEADWITTVLYWPKNSKHLIHEENHPFPSFSSSCLERFFCSLELSPGDWRRRKRKRQKYLYKNVVYSNW